MNIECFRKLIIDSICYDADTIDGELFRNVVQYTFIYAYDRHTILLNIDFQLNGGYIYIKFDVLTFLLLFKISHRWFWSGFIIQVIY